jgi:gliding motility-associated-like protein
MKLLFNLVFNISFFFVSTTTFAQVFWTETFGSGCNQGTSANGYATPNGVWTISATGFNGALANVWYISATENGEGVGHCGSGCGNNPTLHIGSGFFDFGAAYVTDNSFGDPTTSTRAESPLIDCSGRTDICLSFEYIENGDGAIDNHILWYFDGTVWSILDDTPKTPISVCAPQSEWAAYNISLPSSADNNPNVRLGFEWLNNDDAIGTDPSVAIYNIRLTGVDNEVPSLNCATTVNVFLDNDCVSTIPDLTLPPQIVAWDNCTSIADLVINQDIPSGTPIAGHLTDVLVEVTVQDLSGNSNSCFIQVRALDSIQPILDCPTGNIPGYASGLCEFVIPDFTILLDPQDNCTSFNDMFLNQTPIAGTIITSNQLVVYTAQDEAGNVAQCQFTVEFLDTISPNITCPAPQTQNTAIASCDTLVLDYRSSIIWSDNCSVSSLDMTFTQIPSPLSTIGLGTNLITIIAEDASGNSMSCTFNVDVIDNVPPVIVDCVPDTVQFVNVACNSNLVNYTSLVVATDNCSASGNLVVNQSPAPGTLFSGAGSIVNVTLTVLDQAGNSAACNFEVELIDSIAPEPVCPLPATVSVNADCEYVMTDFTALAAATDNCTSLANFTYNQAPLVGTVLTTGIYVVEIAAIDESGNSGGCTFNLTVTDNTAPVISDCPSAQIISTNGDCEGVIPDLTALVVASDNCDLATELQISQTPVAGTIVTNSGSITITVSDLSGNNSQCLVSYTLEDTDAPVLVCPTEDIVTTNADCQYTVPDYGTVVSISDNCSPLGSITYSQTPAAGVIFIGAVLLEIEVEDQAGNTATCQIQILPDDQVDPVIVCPSDQLVNNGSSCDYEVDDFIPLANAGDNCPGFSVAQIPAVGTEIGTGEYVIILEITDGSGNSASCSFQLTVTEDENPEITCPTDIESCDPIVNYALPVVDDNCGVLGLSQIDGTGLTSGNAFPIGITIQTYEVTDLSGNTATCSFNIEVFPFPSQALILTSTTELCDTTSLILEAEAPMVGSGEWSVITGTGTLNNQFATSTGANNLVFGLNQFVWTVSTSACGFTADTLSVVVYQLPFPAVAQSDLILCNNDGINISANTPNVGQGLWYSVDPGVQFLNAESPNTLASNLQAGDNLLVWQISNGNCPVSTDTLVVFAYYPATILTNDTTICIENNQILLSGVPAPEGVSSFWYQITGLSNIEDVFASATLASSLIGGVNSYVYAYNHPVCGPSTDTVHISVQLCGEFDPLIPTVFTPNNDGKNDLFVIDNLHALYPNCLVKIVNRWGSLVFESEGYENPWDGTNMNNGELLPAGTYFYRVWLNDMENGELTGPISIVR